MVARWHAMPARYKLTRKIKMFRAGYDHYGKCCWPINVRKCTHMFARRKISTNRVCKFIDFEARTNIYAQVKETWVEKRKELAIYELAWYGGTYTNKKNKLTNFVVARNVNYHYYFIALRWKTERRELRETSSTAANCEDEIFYVEKLYHNFKSSNGCIFDIWIIHTLTVQLLFIFIVSA